MRTEKWTEDTQALIHCCHLIPKPKLCNIYYSIIMELLLSSFKLFTWIISLGPVCICVWLELLISNHVSVILLAIKLTTLLINCWYFECSLLRLSAPLENSIREELSVKQPESDEWFWNQQHPMVVSTFVSYFERDPRFTAATTRYVVGYILLNYYDAWLKEMCLYSFVYFIWSHQTYRYAHQ